MLPLELNLYCFTSARQAGRPAGTARIPTFPIPPEIWHADALFMATTAIHTTPPADRLYTGARCQVKLFSSVWERLAARANLKFREYWKVSLFAATAVRLFFCSHTWRSLYPGGCGSMAPKMPSGRWAKNLFHFVRDARANEKTRAACGNAAAPTTQTPTTYTPGDMLMCTLMKLTKQKLISDSCIGEILNKHSLGF